MSHDDRDERSRHERPDMSHLREGGSSTEIGPGRKAEGEGSGAGLTQPYMVQKGDTLRTIAEHFYGDAEQWRRIAEANPSIVDRSDDAIVGQQIMIPYP